MNGRRLLSAFLCITILFGCERRELTRDYIEGAELSFILDWSRAGLDPEGATILIYPETGSVIERLTMKDTNTLFLNVGTYKIIAFNETTIDFDNLAFRGTDHFETIEVYSTNDFDTRLPGDTLYDNPDPLAVSVIEQFKVTEEMVEATRTRARSKTKALDPLLTLRLQPAPVVYPMIVEAHIHNLQNVASAGCYITGFATGRFLGREVTNAESSIQKLTFTEREFTEGSSTDGFLRGTFTGFGLREAESRVETRNGYRLFFSSLLIDGSSFQQEFDIDNYIEIVDVDLSVEISILLGLDPEGGDDPLISIPDVEQSGGFDVGVGGWDDIVIPVDMF